ncbi:uncharacterized protein LOC125701544 isoform X2 [Lagopus muta]|uniref:uncharacterized protein LOC125701544 isoform X2 n=1 Tax=Lagopus muta TaxID=64668 RepID=UPI00209D6BB3|nr:uncharacterized protein LOC125701544 isoform X2 [Lagopus muta]
MVAEHWASAGGREGEERGKTPRRKGGGHFELLQWEELEQLVQSMQPYRIGECQGQPPSPRLQLDELPLCAQTVGCAAVLGCTAPAESPLPALQLHPCFFASHTKPQGLSCRSVFTLRMLGLQGLLHCVLYQPGQCIVQSPSGREPLTTLPPTTNLIPSDKSCPSTPPHRIVTP